MRNATAASEAITRRTFLKGAAALGALIPLGGMLAACSGTSSEAPQASSEEAPASSAATDDAASPSEAGAAAGGPVLVAYYSAQGHTQAVAEAIADELGADTFIITPTQPYSTEDLNYNDQASRVSVEHEDANRHVDLEAIAPDNFDDYAAVLVGYPIWWGEAAWVVDDFASENDFDGKTVIPFCTSASSSLGRSGELLAQMAGSGNWQEGMRFRQNADESDVRAWASSLGL